MGTSNSVQSNISAVIALMLLNTIKAAQSEIADAVAGDNSNFVYLGIIAGLILCFLIYKKVTQSDEFTEQLTMKTVVENNGV